jgi:hypothetical protein
MPDRDDHKKIARVMSLRADVLDHTARMVAVVERGLRPVDHLDYVVRRWLIPPRSMPHKKASMQSSAVLSSVQAAIGRHLRAEYALERLLPARLANLLREFEQRNNKPEAIAGDGYASAA